MKFGVSWLILAVTLSLANGAFDETDYLRGSNTKQGEETAVEGEEPVDPAAFGYNCADGCDLSERPPVCGVDGVTYFNQCLALCQGVKVQRNGACPRDPPIRPDDDSYVREGKVPQAALNAFRAEKLKFVAKRKLNKTLVPDDEEPVDDNDPGNPGNKPDVPPGQNTNSSQPGNGNKPENPGQGNNPNNQDPEEEDPDSAISRQGGGNNPNKPNGNPGNGQGNPGGGQGNPGGGQGNPGGGQGNPGGGQGNPGGGQGNPGGGQGNPNKPGGGNNTTDPDETPEDTPGGGMPEDIAMKIRVKRITKDGDEYAATLDVSELPMGNETMSTDGVLGPNPTPEGTLDNTTRFLSILGPDTRSQTTAYSYPNWRLAALDYNNVGRCSGAIVGSSAVVTAAHCVYNSAASNWMIPDRVAPGRYRTGTSSRDPWGTWNVNYVSVFYQYLESGSANYDVAVVNTGSGSWVSTPIGDYMGRLGMKVQPCSYSEQGMRITGYPGDKPSGSMWSTGVCDDWWYGCNSYSKIYHQCDSSGGMSGSAIRDNSNSVVGVHTHGASAGWNSGFAISSNTLGTLRNWANV